MPRWNGYWASQFYAGALTPEVNRKKRKPFGPLVEMLRDTAECSNLWCEDRHDFVVGAGCQNCEMRKEDKKADRDRERREAQQDADRQARRGASGDAAAGQLPAQRDSNVLHTPRIHRECAEDSCALRLPEDWDDELCKKCRTRVNRAAQMHRERQEVDGRQDAFASVGPAPF